MAAPSPRSHPIEWRASWVVLAAVVTIILHVQILAWAADAAWFTLDDFGVFESLQRYHRFGQPYLSLRNLTTLKGPRDLFRFPLYDLITLVFGFSYPAFLATLWVIRLSGALAGWLLARTLGMSRIGALFAVLFYVSNPAAFHGGGAFWFGQISQPISQALILFNLYLVASLPERNGQVSYWSALIATQILAFIAHEQGVLLLAYQTLVALMVFPHRLREPAVVRFAIASTLLTALRAAHLVYFALQDMAYGGVASAPSNIASYLSLILKGPIGWLWLLFLLPLWRTPAGRTILSRMGAFALCWVLISIVPYVLNKGHFNDYYLALGEFGVGLLMGSMLQFYLERTQPAPGKDGNRPERLASTDADQRRWPAVSAGLIVLVLWTIDTAGAAARFREYATGGIRSKRVIEALAQAAGLLRPDYEARLARPYVAHATVPRRALYVEEDPMNVWTELGQGEAIRAILWDVFQPIYYYPRFPEGHLQTVARPAVALSLDGDGIPHVSVIP